MTDELITNKKYKKALKAYKQYRRSDEEKYCKTPDCLISHDYTPALKEKWDYLFLKTMIIKNGDFGEKYVDEYLSEFPESCDAIECNAMIMCGKNKLDESLAYFRKSLISISSTG